MSGTLCPSLAAASSAGEPAAQEGKDTHTIHNTTSIHVHMYMCTIHNSITVICSKTVTAPMSACIDSMVYTCMHNMVYTCI